MKYQSFLERQQSNENLAQFLKSHYGISNYRLNDDGTIDVPNDVNIYNLDQKALYTMTGYENISFGMVGGKFSLVDNNVQDYSILPFQAKNYYLAISAVYHNNFWARLKELYTWEHESSSFTDKDKLLSSVYIERAVNSGLLKKYSDELDEYTWQEAQEEYSEIHQGDFSKYPYFTSHVLDENQNELSLADVFAKVKNNQEGYAANLVGIVFEDSQDSLLPTFEMVTLKDFYLELKKIGRLGYIKKNRRDRENFEYKAHMLLHKADNVDRDRENQCYVFIAKPGFVEQADGSYKKSIEIENLYPIDIYDKQSYSSIEMMRLRTRFDPGSNLYSIWLPNGFFSSEEQVHQPLPYQLDLIDKYKERI